MTAPSDDADASRVSDQHLREQSLRTSVVEGCVWSVMHGVGERYVPAFVALATPNLFAVGAMAALPSFFGAIVQCFAADFTDRLGQRRPVFVWAALLQSFMWLPIVGAIFVGGIAGYWLMLAAFIVQLGLQNCCLPPWASLMGDLVPPQRRGQYFGMRNLFSGTTILVSFFLAGIGLDHVAATLTAPILGRPPRDVAFAALFVLAFVMRFISAILLARMYEPPYQRASSDHFTLVAFVRRMPSGHFGRFVFFVACFHVGIGFLSPYLGWYLLTGLHVSPTTYALVLTVQLVAIFGSQWCWGRLGDRAGNKHVLSIGAFGLAATPALLLLSDSLSWMFIVQIWDGLAMAAWQIAASNYIYDIVTPPKRARCVAYYNLFLWSGWLLGALGGAVAGTFMPVPLNFAGFHIAQAFGVILLGSLIFRAIPLFTLLRTFAEVRVAHRLGEAADPGPA